MELYIGLMSGTSADGIDAALVDFSQPQPQVMGTHYIAYTPDLRQRILGLCQTGENEIQRLGELDIILGNEFAKAANDLLQKLHVPPQAVKAIGSHGQTIRHAPNSFSIQIADPNTIAAKTGITTVADFRRKDIALGGQGAPLVPAFHHHIFATPKQQRAIVNIGGIANVTLLQNNKVTGFDTGPGNVLLDAWIAKHENKFHDEHGAWSAAGKVCDELLALMLTDNYFSLPAPKSTGREYFNYAWIESQLNKLNKTIKPVDVQTTLVELTAQSILNTLAPHEFEILICGGGVHNKFLMQRLTQLAGPHLKVSSTQNYGIDPDWVEAVAFAWLAKQTLNRQPGNLPSVTGATQLAVLGGIYYGV